MTAPANSNVLSPFAPAALRQLQSDIRYQLRRAPFGLTLGDLQANLNEDIGAQTPIALVQMAVDHLIVAGDAEMQSRGELDFVVAATSAHRRPPPKGTLAHRATPRPLGSVIPRAPMPPGLGQQLAHPAQDDDYSLSAAEGIVYGFLAGIALTCMGIGMAAMAGWL